MLTYKIHLLRHGITKANLDNRYIGKTDEPLCREGKEQLFRLLETKEYPDVDRVYTSPLSRAVQTAELLYPERLLCREERLSELNFGDFENRTILDLERDPAFRDWISQPGKAAPGGESGEDLAGRTEAALNAIFTEMMEKRLSSVAVVTHAGVITGLLASFGLPQRESLRWTCKPGEGYTLLMTPQMWMRDQKFEVYSAIPWDTQDAMSETTAFWEDLEGPLDTELESENNFDE